MTQSHVPFDGFFLDLFEPIFFLSVFEHNGDLFLDILETMEGVFFYILEPCTMLTYNALFWEGAEPLV